MTFSPVTPAPLAASAEPLRPVHWVVMGVAGCGKSAVGRRLAARLGLPWIEGDDFHPESNVRKMSAGQPLDDADRAGWLGELGRQLVLCPQGAVLSCSALKLAYRDRLRQAVPGLRFVHLAITPEEARRRVANRPGHFYPPSLVDSQFAALEEPGAEPGVLVVDGAAPLDRLAEQAAAWGTAP